MAVTPQYENGRLVGYSCKDGSHMHGNSAEAEECEKDPSQYTEAERQAKKDKEKQRVLDIRNNPGFEDAIDAVRELGAEDDEAAEKVVISHGINKVLAAREAVRALKIPAKAKSKEPIPPKA